MDLTGRQEPGQIHATDHAPRDGIDPHDPVGGPDVRVDLATDEFELVERFDRTAGVGDVEHAADCERHRIEETQPRGAVAHDERGAVVGEAPALAGVGELTGQAEPEIVDEALLRLPRELNDPALEDREALGEVRARHAPPRQDAAGLEVDPPHARPAVEPGALVERTVVEDEALRERVGVVWPIADDLDAVRRNIGLGEGNGRGRPAARREHREERGSESDARQRPRRVRTAKRNAAWPWRA